MTQEPLFVMFDPEALPIYAPMTATDTQIVGPFGFFDKLGKPQYVFVEDEWMRVTGQDLVLDRPDFFITETLSPGDTVMTVDDTSGFYANSVLGVVDTFNVGGDPVTVTDVLDATHIAILPFTGGIVNALPYLVGLGAGDNLRVLYVQRGALGTTAAAHPRWAPVGKLYRPSDFATSTSNFELVAFSTRLRYPGGSETYPGVIRGNLGGFRSRAAEATGVFMLPVPAGGVFRLLNDTDIPVITYVTVYVVKVADGTGVPLTAADTQSMFYANWAATARNFATFTYDDASNSNVGLAAGGAGIEVATAGWYLFDVSITAATSY